MTHEATPQAPEMGLSSNSTEPTHHSTETQSQVEIEPTPAQAVETIETVEASETVEAISAFGEEPTLITTTATSEATATKAVSSSNTASTPGTTIIKPTSYYSAPLTPEPMEPFVEPQGQASEKFMALVEFNVPGKKEAERFGEWLRNGGWELDALGNARLSIPEADGSESKTGFCAHMDDVSRVVRRTGATQYVEEGVRKVRSDGKSCLGADDKAGMSVLLYMIEQKVPGVYHLFVEEESGMIGSQAAAERGWGKGLNFMVAFDRRGTSDIITHQCGERTCSDAFAAAFAEHARNHGLDLKGDPGGSFTDSYAFASVVHECTNIAIGYMMPHGNGETQNLDHLDAVAQASASFPWKDFAPVREASSVPTRDEKRAYRSYTSYAPDDMDDEIYGYGRYGRYGRYSTKHGYRGAYPNDLEDEDDGLYTYGGWSRQTNPTSLYQSAGYGEFGLSEKPTLLALQSRRDLIGALARLSAKKANGAIDEYKWNLTAYNSDSLKRMLENKIIEDPEGTGEILAKIDLYAQRGLFELLQEQFDDLEHEIAEKLQRAIKEEEMADIASAFPTEIAGLLAYSMSLESCWEQSGLSDQPLLIPQDLLD